MDQILFPWAAPPAPPRPLGKRAARLLAAKLRGAAARAQGEPRAHGAPRSAAGAAWLEGWDAAEARIREMLEGPPAEEGPAPALPDTPEIAALLAGLAELAAALHCPARSPLSDLPCQRPAHPGLAHVYLAPGGRETRWYEGEQEEDSGPPVALLGRARELGEAHRAAGAPEAPIAEVVAALWPDLLPPLWAPVEIEYQRGHRGAAP